MSFENGSLTFRALLWPANARRPFEVEDLATCLMRRPAPLANTEGMGWSSAIHFEDVELTPAKLVHGDWLRFALVTGAKKIPPKLFAHHLAMREADYCTRHGCHRVPKQALSDLCNDLECALLPGMPVVRSATEVAIHRGMGLMLVDSASDKALDAITINLNHCEATALMGKPEDVDAISAPLLLAGVEATKWKPVHWTRTPQSLVGDIAGASDFLMWLLWQKKDEQKWSKLLGVGGPLMFRDLDAEASSVAVAGLVRGAKVAAQCVQSGQVLARAKYMLQETDPQEQASSWEFVLDSRLIVRGLTLPKGGKLSGRRDRFESRMEDFGKWWKTFTALFRDYCEARTGDWPARDILDWSDQLNAKKKARKAA